MKLIQSLIVGMFALALVASPVYAGSCCDKAKAEGKECQMKCCKEAKAAGKACEKCAGKTDSGKHKGEEKK
jgi:hypothetical protein